jgi:hypothetical protein
LIDQHHPLFIVIISFWFVLVFPKKNLEFGLQLLHHGFLEYLVVIFVTGLLLFVEVLHSTKEMKKGNKEYDKKQRVFQFSHNYIKLENLN